MRNRILMLLLALMLALIPCAGAEGLPEGAEALVPAGAVLEERSEADGRLLLTLCLPDTGERMLLCWDIAANRAISLETVRNATADPKAASVERSRAEALIQQAHPGCRILFSENVNNSKHLGVAADDFCGVITLADDRIVCRSLQAGEIFRDGLLTPDGAMQVLALHRPEAQFRAVELEEDDGVRVYEGEALLDGEEYEFELDASTGKLLEWERD